MGEFSRITFEIIKIYSFSTDYIVECRFQTIQHPGGTKKTLKLEKPILETDFRNILE